MLTERRLANAEYTTVERRANCPTSISRQVYILRATEICAEQLEKLPSTEDRGLTACITILANQTGKPYAHLTLTYDLDFQSPASS